MGENPLNQASDVIGNESLKDITNILKKSTVGSGEISIEENNSKVTNSVVNGKGVEENAGDIYGSKFKVASTNLPEKTSVWTKVKNALFYEIKVELTPYQQKVEREINEFLHQEITLEKVHDFLFQEITFGKKNK